MEDFEITNLGDVQTKVDNGIGFVVGGHNYGRVDRMSVDELGTVAREMDRITEQAGELLDAIALISFEQQD